MQRPIVGFHRDAEDHWVADLSCGHARHTRHDPPFQQREWVLTEEGRAARLGVRVACVRCERRELPAGFAPYRRTPSFTQETLPAALRSNHSTRAGVWALIHVEQGELEYAVQGSSPEVQVLRPGVPGVVLAEQEHRVRPNGPCTFYVEFWRREGDSGAPR